MRFEVYTTSRIFLCLRYTFAAAVQAADDFAIVWPEGTQIVPADWPEWPPARLVNEATIATDTMRIQTVQRLLAGGEILRAVRFYRETGV